MNKELTTKALVFSYTYLLRVFQNVFYAPMIYSVAFFVIIIPLVLFPDHFNPVLYLFSSGESYNGQDILSRFAILSIILSAIISLVEMFMKKQIIIKGRTQIFWSAAILVIGFSVLLFTNKELSQSSEAILVCTIIGSVSLVGVVVGVVTGKFINFINWAFDPERQTTNHLTLNDLVDVLRGKNISNDNSKTGPDSPQKQAE